INGTSGMLSLFFFFKQKTAYELGLGIPAEPLFRSFVFRLLRLKRFSTFSVKVLNLFSRSRRKTNKRKSKHSAMLRNKETRHRMFKIGRASCRERGYRQGGGGCSCREAAG